MACISLFFLAFWFSFFRPISLFKDSSSPPPTISPSLGSLSSCIDLGFDSVLL
ncbi:hypothetical protein RchiOBHm_Chr5g0012771 [Rosa chinensis]|uniref:Uncharacterized protein n=1 Tax=Rosa chinensis TaxID=74649 RepID=A0A2P6Q572_ROSCH|nr:hypothetical protein RchiOBHm_Chr5g0012771 [Rosa chinensis]